MQPLPAELDGILEIESDSSDNSPDDDAKKISGSGLSRAGTMARPVKSQKSMEIKRDIDSKRKKFKKDSKNFMTEEMYQPKKINMPKLLPIPAIRRDRAQPRRMSILTSLGL